jgi:hypothetical protein
VPLLAAGDTKNNDPNDARSVAVAALRSPSVRAVAAEGHQAVMKLWAKRHRDLTSLRTQVVCQLHAVLCELVAGGVGGQIRSAMAVKLLETSHDLGLDRRRTLRSAWVATPVRYWVAQSAGPPVTETERFFMARDFDGVVPQEPPPEPTEDEWRFMSSIERAAHRRMSSSHWADLRHRVTKRLIRWYGRGMSDDEAIQRVCARWCVERDGGSRSGARPLP